MVPNKIESRKVSDINPYQSEQIFETEVEVTDPQLHRVEDKPDHVTYRVSSVSSYPSWSGRSHSVTRRYNDFVWLKAQLDFEVLTSKTPLPVRALPELPDTESFFGWFTGERFQADFIERRRFDLNKWINIAANHDIARESKFLLGFLQEQDLSTLREQSAAAGWLALE